MNKNSLYSYLVISLLSANASVFAHSLSHLETRGYVQHDVSCILSLLSCARDSDEILEVYQGLAHDIVQAPNISGLQELEALEALEQSFYKDVLIPYFNEEEYRGLPFEAVSHVQRLLRAQRKESEKKLPFFDKICLYMDFKKNPVTASAIVGGVVVCSAVVGGLVVWGVRRRNRRRGGIRGSYEGVLSDIHSEAHSDNLAPAARDYVLLKQQIISGEVKRIDVDSLKDKLRKRRTLLYVGRDQSVVADALARAWQNNTDGMCGVGPEHCQNLHVWLTEAESQYREMCAKRAGGNIQEGDTDDTEPLDTTGGASSALALDTSSSSSPWSTSDDDG